MQEFWKQKKYRIVITARENSLSRFKKEPFKDNDRFLIRALDVNVSDERKRLIHEINRTWGGVDILINNAGISFRAVVEHMNEVEELKLERERKA